MTKNQYDPNIALEQLFVNKLFKAPAAVNESQEVVNEGETVEDGESELEFDSILEEIFGDSEKSNIDEMETEVPMDGSETEVPEGEPDGDEGLSGEEDEGGEEVSVPKAIIEKLYDVLGDILNYSGDEGSDEPAIEDELSAENVPTESLKSLKEKKYPQDYKGKPATKTKFLKNQGSGKGLPKGDANLSQYIVGKVNWTTSKSKDKTGIDKNV